MGSAKKLFSTLTIIILSLWLLIDTVNGYLIQNGIYVIGNISLGDIVRALFIPILILALRIKRRDVWLLAVFYLLLLLSIAQYILFDIEFVQNLNIVVKLSLPILIFIFIKNNKYFGTHPDVIRKVVYANSVILLLNLYVSYFGLGFSNYQNLGGTGFFYAGNEVGGLLLVIYAFFMYQFRKELKKGLITSVLFFIAGIGLASKSAIFGPFIIFCLYIFIYQKISKYKVATFFVLMAAFIYKFLSSYINLAIDRWEFFINNYGAIIYLTGGFKRWQAINDYFGNLQENPLLIITGYGWQGVAEQNFIDLVEGYGILGLLIFSIWIYWVIRLYKTLEYRPNSIYITLAFLLIIGVATLAGHIMQSAMIAPFIAILANSNIFKE